MNLNLKISSFQTLYYRKSSIYGQRGRNIESTYITITLALSIALNESTNNATLLLCYYIPCSHENVIKESCIDCTFKLIRLLAFINLSVRYKIVC